MVGWRHWLNGHKSEQTLEDGEEQGSLACCSLLGHKDSDMTERLNNSNNIYWAHPHAVTCCKDLTCIYSWNLHSSPVKGHLHFTNRETEALEAHLPSRICSTDLRTFQTDSGSKDYILSEHTMEQVEDTPEPQSIHGYTPNKGSSQSPPRHTASWRTHTTSRRQWRTGKSGMLQFMGLQRVRHNWVTERQHTTCLLTPPIIPLVGAVQVNASFSRIMGLDSDLFPRNLRYKM